VLDADEGDSFRHARSLENHFDPEREY
jgi:hypothetical protein